MHRSRHAKIVATLGPASSSPTQIRALFEAGVDMFRLNFSHGTHDDHRARLTAIRALEAEKGHPIAVLQDLQGPKIRLGKLKDGKRMLESGTSVRIRHADATETSDDLCIPLPEIFEAVMPGKTLLVDDGKVRLEVTGIADDTITAKVIIGGPVSNHKGVNLPDTVLQLSPITTKDRADLAFGLDMGVDWVAFSFVQRPSDLIEAQQLVGGRAGVMAKIEKPSALSQIDDIVTLADAIMVARGDLGVEIPTEDVPGAQKDLVRLCRMAAKPVIIATQMLESMIVTPTPTRAEASDVATAIYDGADAVMLSAESASGAYPLEAVQTMDRIIRRTEQHRSYRPIIEALKPALEPLPQHAISAAAAEVADAIGAAAIVAFTSSGTTANRIARQRSAVPILGLTPDIGIARRLALLWGTQSMVSQNVDTYDAMVKQAVEQARAAGIVTTGQTLVVVSGIPFGLAGSTNNMRIVTA